MDGHRARGTIGILHRVVAVVPRASVLMQGEVIDEVISRSNRTLRDTIHAIHVRCVQLTDTLMIFVSQNHISSRTAPTCQCTEVPLCFKLFVTFTINLFHFVSTISNPCLLTSDYSPITPTGLNPRPRIHLIEQLGFRKVQPICRIPAVGQVDIVVTLDSCRPEILVVGVKVELLPI